MSHEEYVRWGFYARKNGLNINRSIERAAALVSRSIAGGKFEDYLPQRGEPVAEGPVSVEQAMAILGGTIKRR